MSELSIRDASAADAPAIAAIYNHYVLESTATFELDAVSDEAMTARVKAVLAAGLPYLVADAGATIVGYAYAGPFQERAAYRHSVETTVYLGAGGERRGTGSALYEVLLARLDALTPEESPRHAPVHRAYARIALPNAGSVALHERFGFRQAATLAEVGRKFDRWIDVGFWERKA